MSRGVLKLYLLQNKNVLILVWTRRFSWHILLIKKNLFYRACVWKFLSIIKKMLDVLIYLVFLISVNQINIRLFINQIYSYLGYTD